ncbi:Phage small terminase subunit [Pseudomonas putida]|nr:Phage small terminase subunit [Pseudomonas putida]CAB5724088.1 Phage small terminase subunit [Pseudomonas putida]CAC9678983.1 Phage small terminase subunit [Pseudomonas putida]CAC9680424.1 Phage small terminase subunit [Pseudomonas putida]CAC9690400.1 Phage small terminase subunit [Pseudomonas putida]
MALTLSQQTQLRKRAAKEAASTAPAALMDGLNQYELMLAKLQQDQLRLRQIQSIQSKCLLKAQLIGEYKPYIDGVLSAGRGAQDDVVTTIMLWRFDAGDWDAGLDVAAYVLEHGLKMANRFDRTSGCLIAEEVAENALRAQKADKPFPIEVLQRTAELTKDQDMPDEVSAKLKLALARATLQGLDANNPGQPGQLQRGIDLLKRAIEQDAHCGGKKILESAERLLKKFAGPAS